MLTRAGRSTLALAAVLLAVGRVFAIIELFVFAVALVLAVVVAVLMVRIGEPRVTVSRVVSPQSAQAGDTVRVAVTVTNVGTRRTPSMRLVDPVSDNGVANIGITSLTPGAQYGAAYRLDGLTRGLLTIGPMRVNRTDVLGLAKRASTGAPAVELAVLPRHHPVPMPGASGSAGPLGALLHRKALSHTGNEFHALREYQQGDDLRRISWKASARSTNLIVRDTAVEGVKRMTVVLDTAAGEHDEASFERAVSAAASLITSAVAAGFAARLVAPDVDLRGPGVDADALAWLTTVKAPELASNDPQPAPLPSLRNAEGLGLTVVVAATPDAPIVATTRAQLGPEDVVVVVATFGLTEFAPSLVVDALGDESLAEGWGALIGINQQRTAPTDLIGAPPT
ncbi:MAG: DUF58 domain-containing protein [Actinomycetota bacterium]